MYPKVLPLATSSRTWQKLICIRPLAVMIQVKRSVYCPQWPIRCSNFGQAIVDSVDRAFKLIVGTSAMLTFENVIKGGNHLLL